MGSKIYFDCRIFVIILFIICIPYYIYVFNFSNFLIIKHSFNKTYLDINKMTFSSLEDLDKYKLSIHNTYHRGSFGIVSDIIQKQIQQSKSRKEKIYKLYFSRSRNVPNFNCKRMFESEVPLNSTLYHRYLNELKVWTALDYNQRTRNCSAFIEERGYITHYLTKEERNFPIAYSILMYKDVEQAERLLRAIYRPQNSYCIHVDSKTKDVIYDAMRNISNCLKNVFVLEKRVNVIWGKMSVLEPELLCMQELLKRNKRWKYFINLTGQEFPLKTNYELVKILKAYNGSNDVETSIRE